jgi:hypothetical protein
VGDADYWAFGGIIDWIQLDSQDPRITEPVVLAPTPMVIHKPTFATIVELTVRNSKNLYHVSYMGALLQELSLNVEQRDMLNGISFLTDLFEFLENEELAEGASRNNSDSQVVTEVQDPSSSQTVSLAEPGGNTSVYIEYLKLNPVKIKLNFLKGGEDDQEEISLHLVKRMVGKSTNSSHQRAQTLRFIVDIAMAVTSNISDAPIILNGMLLEHIYKPPDRIRDTVISHYFQSLMWQLAKFCNFDFLGNPVSFAKTLGTGLTEFFIEPYQGMLNASPGAFASGVLKGSRSLVQHTATGVFGAVESITDAVGSSAVQFIHLDAEFKQMRLRKTKLKCRNMFLRPFQDIGYGVVYGAIGIVRDPCTAYSDTKAEGCTGKTCAIIQGCGSGLVGLAAKPLVGVFDAVSHTAEFLSFTLDCIAATPRLRPIRRCRDSHIFGPGGRLLHFEPKIARGGSIMFDRNMGHTFGIVKVLRDVENQIKSSSGTETRSKTKEREERVITAEFIAKQQNEEYALVVTTKKLAILQRYRGYRHLEDETWDAVLTVDISKEITKKEREGSAFQHFNDRHGHIGELHLDKTNGATLHFRNRKVHTDASGRHKLIRIYFCAKMLSLNQWRCHWQRQLDSHKHTSTRPLDLRVKFLEECEDCAKLAEELKQYEHDLSLDNCGIISVGSWNLHSPEDCRKWAEERKQKFATKPVDAKDDAPEEDIFNTWMWKPPPKEEEFQDPSGQEPDFALTYRDQALSLHTKATEAYPKALLSSAMTPDEKWWTSKFRSGAVTVEELDSAREILAANEPDPKEYLEMHPAEEIEILRANMGGKSMDPGKAAQLKELMQIHVERRKTMYWDVSAEAPTDGLAGVAAAAPADIQTDAPAEIAASPGQGSTMSPLTATNSSLADNSFRDIENRLDHIESLLQSRMGPPSSPESESLSEQNATLRSQNDLLHNRILRLEELLREKDEGRLHHKEDEVEAAGAGAGAAAAEEALYESDAEMGIEAEREPAEAQPSTTFEINGKEGDEVGEKNGEEGTEEDEEGGDEEGWGGEEGEEVVVVEREVEERGLIE